MESPRSRGVWDHAVGVHGIRRASACMTVVGLITYSAVALITCSPSGGSYPALSRRLHALAAQAVTCSPSGGLHTALHADYMQPCGRITYSAVALIVYTSCGKTAIIPLHPAFFVI